MRKEEAPVTEEKGPGIRRPGTHGTTQGEVRKGRSRKVRAYLREMKEDLIAEFYLVDRGLRHRLPGFSSMGRLVILP